MNIPHWSKKKKKKKKNVMNTELQKRWDSQENIKFLLAELNDTL